MLARYWIKNGKLLETADEAAPIWVYGNPDENERKQIVERFGIDEHTLSSSMDPDELGRVELEDDHALVIFKRPKNYSSEDNFLFKVWTYGLFLFRDRLVVVRPDDLPLFDERHFNKLRSHHDLALRLMHRTINHFVGHLKGINRIAEELEQKVNTSMENRYLLNMFTLEKSLVYYLYGINANGVAIEKLNLSAAKLGFPVECQEFIDDMIIENNQCNRQAEILSGILSGLMDARASIVSNNLNVLIKKLNIVTILVMVPTLVVSVFSMNVMMPFNHDHPLAFWGIVATAALSAMALIAYWRRKKW